MDWVTCSVIHREGIPIITTILLLLICVDPFCLLPLVFFLLLRHALIMCPFLPQAWHVASLNLHLSALWFVSPYQHSVLKDQGKSLYWGQKSLVPKCPLFKHSTVIHFMCLEGAREKFLILIDCDVADLAGLLYVARNGLWSSRHPYVCIIQALVIANYKFTSCHEYHYFCYI